MESQPQEHSVREGQARAGAPPRCDTGNSGNSGTNDEIDLPGFRPDVAANDTRMSRLARAIEEEIIPRLMIAHRSAPELPVRASGADRSVTLDDVKQFAKLVLSQDEDIAFTAVEALRARGVCVESIYVDLLARTARYLGDLWNEDLCSFTDVTVGLGRLQRVLRELSPALGGLVEHPAEGRRILLLPSPGEQHTFGLVMVGEFFRKAGWDVTGGAWAAGGDAAAMVGSEWFDVVGFSLGAAVHIGALAETIRSVRHATCNQQVSVLVGGPLFELHPEYVAEVGADGMTVDGREAPALAERLIAASNHLHSPRG